MQQINFEDKFHDEMLDTYMNKNFNAFWHCWKKKTSSKCLRAASIAGSTNDSDITNKFAEHFATVCEVKGQFNIAHLDDTATYKVKDCLFTVVDVDRVIKNCLKFGKAAGRDNVRAEHIIYAPPSIVMFLCNLFNLIIQYDYVPAKFGTRIIIPLVKDRLGDISVNYRAITVGCVISKVFELFLNDKFGNFLTSHHLQFGFKKGIGCANAVYTQCLS